MTRLYRWIYYSVVACTTTPEWFILIMNGNTCNKYRTESVRIYHNNTPHRKPFVVLLICTCISLWILCYGCHESCIFMASITYKCTINKRLCHRKTAIQLISIRLTMQRHQSIIILINGLLISNT